MVKREGLARVNSYFAVSDTGQCMSQGPVWEFIPVYQLRKCMNLCSCLEQGEKPLHLGTASQVFFDGIQLQLASRGCGLGGVQQVRDHGLFRTDPSPSLASV